ncbi:MAG: cytochrome P450 [Bacteroidota bacterium]
MPNKYHFPDGFSAFQSLAGSFSVVTDPLATLTIRMKKFGGTYSGYIPGRGKVIVTQDPDFVNYVLRENHTNYKKAKLGTAMVAKQLGTSLLFINGDDWRRQRRLIQPGFHQANILKLYETVNKTINGFVANIADGDKVDVYPLMQKLSFSVLINSLFNIDMSPAMTDELCRAFINLQDFMTKDILQPFRRLIYPFTGEERKLVKQWNGVRNMLKGIVEQRRTDETPRHDLLDMLLNARYEDTGEGMTEEQLISEVLILLFAGHETTGSTISWLLYLIAANPNVLDKLKGTITEIDIMDSPRNSYINAIINEGMRLYPSVWITERVTVKDDQFGNFSFPAGTSILTYFYGMHRNESDWEDASTFNPERFLTADGAIDKNIKAYYPFGAGPRMCVGNNFAMAEMAFVIYTIFKTFNITAPSSQPIAWPLLTLRPREVVLAIKRI